MFIYKSYSKFWIFTDLSSFVILASEGAGLEAVEGFEMTVAGLARVTIVSS